LLLLAAAISFSSCKKFDGIDNTKVIRTPYAVFFGERSGLLTKTNDGILYKDIFSPDGVPVRAIALSGDSNIIMIKYSNLRGTADLFLSTNSGRNFNFKINTVDPGPKWSNIILDVPGDRIYVAGTSGVMMSTDNGVTWRAEDRSGISGVSVQSFTYTNDHEIYALDRTGANLYVLPNTASGGVWTQVSVSTGLPTGNDWYLTSHNNTLIAADYKGTSIYYYDKSAAAWKQFNGIPGNQEILSCAAPLNQVVLAGTDSAGIFRLVGDTFQPSNNGLEPFTSVYGITGKQDTYKNGIIKRYVYIATNRGLYRSEDLGQNWVLMKPGDMRAIW
jgi:hypothetical protein